ncbi:monothiol glutaredoxin grx4 [Toensbergia leucococca]|nr:monothiol glutaredoxin grx4 [Toensbergia leucococca]
MSTITEFNEPSDFHSHISSLPSTALLVLSFHTPWAAPCAQMSLILRTLASSYPPQIPPVISFVSINAESLPDISESYDVAAVPYLVLQRDGKVLESVSGSDAGKVRDAVERHAGKGGNTGKVGLPPALEAEPESEGQINGGATKDLSGYAPTANDPATAPEMSSTKGQTEELNKRLGELVKAAPVMLFMKGTPSTPQCGFSRQLVGLLREKGVRYGFFNILADEEVRQGLKLWADWPTFPQLWVGGELVGGLDIVKEELDNDPNFFDSYAVEKGKGGMAAPDVQVQPAAAAV